MIVPGLHVSVFYFHFFFICETEYNFSAKWIIIFICRMEYNLSTQRNIIKRICFRIKVVTKRVHVL